MHFVSLTYSIKPKLNQDDWIEFLQTFKPLGDWHNPIENMWFLCTSFTAKQVYQKITKVAEKCFEIYQITEFNPHDMHGRLLSASWAWINAATETMNENIKIYKDIHADSSYALVGFKGKRLPASGVIYCPYKKPDMFRRILEKVIELFRKPRMGEPLTKGLIL